MKCLKGVAERGSMLGNAWGAVGRRVLWRKPHCDMYLLCYNFGISCSFYSVLLGLISSPCTSLHTLYAFPSILIKFGRYYVIIFYIQTKHKSILMLHPYAWFPFVFVIIFDMLGVNLSSANICWCYSPKGQIFLFYRLLTGVCIIFSCSPNAKFWLHTA
jgi:hypothetical protein